MEPHLNLSVAKANERKYYGRIVIGILKHFGTASTSDAVVRYFANCNVMQSLISGHRLGFIMKRGNTFSLPLPRNF